MKTPRTFKELQDQDEEAEKQFVIERIVPLWKKGKRWSLREIGKEIKASHEQVRQLLIKYDEY